MKVAHLKVLDGVRAIAALMVMFFHFFQTIEQEGAVYDFLRYITAFGRTGVTLFFVLSGFLITRMLISSKGKANYFKHFYIRRALRIFPLYYLFLLIFYYVVPAVTNEPYVGFERQWPYYVYLQNIADSFNWNAYGPGHFWSLAVEENFYLVWPFVVFFVNERWLTRVIVLFLLLSFALRAILLTKGIGGQYFIMSSFDALAIGALVAIKEAQKDFNIQTGKRFLKLLIAFLVPSLAFWFYFQNNGPKAMQVLYFPFITVVYLSLIGYLLSLKENRAVNRLFCSTPLLYLGKISYGMYVYHTVCFYFYFRHFATKSLVVDLPLAFAISILVSSASFHFFETPFLRLKDRFK